MTPVVARDSISNIGASQIRERAAGPPNRRNNSGFLANAPRNSRSPRPTSRGAGRSAREGFGRYGRWFLRPNESSETEDKRRVQALPAAREKPTLSSITPSGSDFTWNYSANVTVDQRVEHDDFFTIYDFGNFVAGSNTQPAGWAFSSALLGRTPPLVLPHDDPGILNLTWTYIGKNPIIGPAPLGIFSVNTNTNQVGTSDFEIGRA